ncbi:hypothetical protein BaRGS_00018927 [Batillaria attramentaria]|uniref:Uncharacterized protein n=1 Tax=Batillaria attramentaria TaxID=370345 RepID=A0ABD0KRZ3_9CAEN
MNGSPAAESLVTSLDIVTSSLTRERQASWGKRYGTTLDAAGLQDLTPWNVRRKLLLSAVVLCAEARSLVCRRAVCLIQIPFTHREWLWRSGASSYWTGGQTT